MTRNCEGCGKPIEERVASMDKPYSFADLSGLPNVYLVGIKVERCSGCDVESPTIPRLGELMRLITRDLIAKPTTLAGYEIRFLRKQAGLASKDFAALLMIDPSTLSRAENGTQDLGESTDHLARAIASAKLQGGEKVAEFLLNRVKDKAASKRRRKLCYTGTKWKDAA